jgi:hypothetical protein
MKRSSLSAKENQMEYAVSVERERILQILEMVLSKMVDNDQWSMTRNEFNDLIDYIAHVEEETNE